MRKTLEHKDAEFRGVKGPYLEIKELTDNGTFEGYGSVFNNVDGGGDLILPGAFSESLAARPARKVKMLWQHDTHQPIGHYTEAFEDAKGLYVKGVLNQEVAKAREVLAMLREGEVDGLSIGYRVTHDEIDRSLGIRRIIKCDLFEVSVVTFPMNPESTVRNVKGGAPTKRELEQLLMRDAGLSALQAKALLASGYNAMPARDARQSDDDPETISDLQALARALRGA